MLSAADRTALPSTAPTFEHWSLDDGEEPELVAAERHCRTASAALVAGLPVGGAHSPTECDETVLAERLVDPDAWSDVGVRPELSDVVTLHTGALKAEALVAGPREAVGEAMARVLDRRGLTPSGTAWAISGHLWYRPGAVLGWHTNGRVPGWRAYLSWTAEPGQSFFRYRDPVDGRIVTSCDTGIDLRLFHVSATDLLWHCVWSGAERHSFGYRLVDVTG